MLAQSRAFYSYLRGVLKTINGNDYDLVFVMPGRLMTAFLGAYVASKLKRPFYSDIRDIFVNTIGELLALKGGKLLTSLFFALEHYAINAANKVNLVSAGFLPYFKKRYPSKEFQVVYQ